ncbi:MAG: acyl carrier protein [Bacteriovoracaceae bacterium]|nr:acyl carrier protein [Bacteriovoracaceae bacterium]
MPEILKKVIEVIEDNEDLNPKISISEITFASRFKEDLGFDSLALMSLVYELQEFYPDLDEMVISQWSTLQDCTEHLTKL